jgi:menaquinone reductase, integral membrane subunit
MDRHLIPRGLKRSPFGRFFLWILFWAAVFGIGLYAMYLCLYEGLNQTNMDNRFAFGLWIYLDLTVIALGAGAFFTGFLLYILRKDELRAVINSAVVLGFICYSGAIVVLMVDVGQPLRAWFTFWHPNVHSMLTEVTFCLTCYLTVLAIEYAPIILKSRTLRQIPSLLVFEHELHKAMVVLAGVGTFLSFFHQGSLGGMFGVMRGRPFAYREAFAIWPTTFFLFILSAAAVGPSFIIVSTWLVSKLSRKTLVKKEVYILLAKVSGILLLIYVFFKGIDTLVWINSTAPSTGFSAFEFYAYKGFGTWILITEILLLGLLPSWMLLNKKRCQNQAWVVAAAFLACAGVVLNRFVTTIQTLSLPTLPFDQFLSYVPSWQEVATFSAVIAYGVLIYSLSFRYTRLFPQEREFAVSPHVLSE